MGNVIFLVVLVMITLGIFIVGIAIPTPRGKRWWWAGFIPAFLTLLLFFLMSITQIHSREEGVESFGGKAVGTLGAGYHWKPIWDSVDKVDETPTTEEYGTGDKGAMDAVPVSLGDGTTADVKTVIRWHLNPAADDYIWSNFKGDAKGEVESKIVKAQYPGVVNGVFRNYNPTAGINIKDAAAANASNFVPDYNAEAADILAAMQKAVVDADGTQLIVIDKITVSGITYAPSTQARIAGIVAQAAKTMQAEQLIQTNVQLAQANDKLTKSLSGPTGQLVLTQECFNDIADGKFAPPVGFSCWPGGSATAVIPAAGK